MVRPRALVFGVVPAAMAMALASCGGPSDRERIISLIRANRNDPARVCAHATPGLLAMHGGRAGCEANFAGFSTGPYIGRISITSISGNKATAAVAGNNVFYTFEFEKVDDTWEVSMFNEAVP